MSTPLNAITAGLFTNNRVTATISTDGSTITLAPAGTTNASANTPDNTMDLTQGPCIVRLGGWSAPNSAGDANCKVSFANANGYIDFLISRKAQSAQMHSNAGYSAITAGAMDATKEWFRFTFTQTPHNDGTSTSELNVDYGPGTATAPSGTWTHLLRGTETIGSLTGTATAFVNATPAQLQNSACYLAAGWQNSAQYSGHDLVVGPFVGSGALAAPALTIGVATSTAIPVTIGAPSGGTAPYPAGTLGVQYRATGATGAWTFLAIASGGTGSIPTTLGASVDIEAAVTDSAATPATAYGPVQTVVADPIVSMVLTAANPTPAFGSPDQITTALTLQSGTVRNATAADKLAYA